MEVIIKAESDVDLMEGEVSSVLWVHPDKAFHTKIIALKGENIPKFAQRRGYPDSFVAVGDFFKVVKGQNFKLQGRWRKDRRGRWCFNIMSYEEITPETDEALVDYLSSGLFKGVGVKTARAIVDMFGQNTLDIIKNNPEQLEKVRGISKVKSQKISEDYQISKHMEALMLSLKPFNIPTRKIIDIHKRYGDEAVKRIYDNPYRLCEEVEGIGFKTADNIARQCEKKPNDDFRIRAGILHTLKQSALLEGHVYLPYELLIIKAKQTLEQGAISGYVNRNDIIRVAINMNNMEEIIIEEDGASYLPLYLGSEKAASYKVRALLQNKQKEFKYDVNDSIAELEKEQEIEFAEQQKEAFHMLSRNNMMIITGGPGTGKTTIIKGIIDIYKKNFPGANVLLAAPTGKAAKRMEEATKMTAKTIHRQLEYKPSEEGGIRCGKDEKNPFETDLIIVDESSMIDTLLFSTFLRAIKPTTSLVMVGDIDQLPSVGAGSVLKDLIESKKVPTVRLDEIFRQADASKIVVNARNINSGNCKIELGEDFEFIEENNPNKIPEIILETFKRELMVVKDINEIQVLSPFRRKTATGVNQLNVSLQEDLNKKDSKKPEILFRGVNFRKYDKVMQYKNNYDKEVFNGDTGIILDVDEKEGTLLVELDEEKIEYERDELEELQLAYATTIHKSQGCEYDTIIIPVSMEHKIMLQRNLLYTGITRAKRKVILVGNKYALNYAIKNNKVSGRFSKLDKRI